MFQQSLINASAGRAKRLASLLQLPRNPAQKLHALTFESVVADRCVLSEPAQLLAQNACISGLEGVQNLSCLRSRIQGVTLRHLLLLIGHRRGAFQQCL
jgi:hypothetical protein